MGPLMYRHRPAYPALFAAAFVLGVGAIVVYGLKKRAEAGHAEPSSVLLAGCVTIGIAGVLLIAAFARYQFTHLWKNTDPAFAKKSKRKTNGGRPGQ